MENKIYLKIIVFSFLNRPILSKVLLNFCSNIIIFINQAYSNFNSSVPSIKECMQKFIWDNPIENIIWDDQQKVEGMNTMINYVTTFLQIYSINIIMVQYKHLDLPQRTNKRSRIMEFFNGREFCKLFLPPIYTKTFSH